MTIGTFCCVFDCRPILSRWIGVPGICYDRCMALSMVVVKKSIPDPVSRFILTEASAASLGAFAIHSLLRLNYGIFALRHIDGAMACCSINCVKRMLQMIIGKFIYPLLSIILIIPAIIYAEKKSAKIRVYCSDCLLLEGRYYQLLRTIGGTAIALLIFTAFACPGPVCHH